MDNELTNETQIKLNYHKLHCFDGKLTIWMFIRETILNNACQAAEMGARGVTAKLTLSFSKFVR